MTIRHVVVWKLSGTDPATVHEQAESVKAALEGLPALISEIRSFQVGINVLDPDGNFDVALISDFDDADALARYIVHPEHQKVVSLIGSVREARAAIDFEV